MTEQDNSISPFEYVKAISTTKENLIVDEKTEIEYNSYIVNRGLSNFPDTLFYANEMNIYGLLDNKLKFDYLINSIRPHKRFSKWLKKDNIESVKLICEYYGYNYTYALQILPLFDKDRLDEMRNLLKQRHDE